ncbi:hypothetical protein CK510_17030 [Brunnivagina elsteri CCALA 953]|uniref:Uncharacterized protein n=1 Tax=Brunnivagina elsteri CCALA 953 TaxID=987040 RepID=A0A2A2TGP6_9CYAN|nr:hypothetical protein CK510_17030 [Calothrix elsteri CCALA 953]
MLKSALLSKSMGVFYCLFRFDSRSLTALLSDSFAIGFRSYMVDVERINAAVIINSCCPVSDGYSAFTQKHRSSAEVGIALLFPMHIVK